MRSTTEPFRVTCRLLDGRLNSADGLLFLDSILYHAWFIKYAPHVLQGLSEDNHPPHFGLPLRQLEGGRYAASCGFYRQHSVDVEQWTKKPNFTDADKMSFLDIGKAAKVDISSGPHRAYRMPNIIRLVDPIEFYGFGTIAKVEELLRCIPSVGKKPAMGWGAVKSWGVEPWPEDWSTWTERYGLMRPMPVDEYGGDDRARYQVRECAIRPPSWKGCNQTLCYVPEVTISAENMHGRGLRGE